MLTALNVARIAKLAALLGFLFPWVLVSCSGQPVGHLNGIDLATGGLTVQDHGAGALPHGHPNLWVALSLAAVVGGIVASFVAPGGRAFLAIGALAVLALAASGIGVAVAGSDAPSEALRPSSPSAAVAASDTASGGVSVELQYGYFLTAAGLVVAIGACGAGLAGRGRGVGG